MNEDKDSLGSRMKEFYENRSKTYLTRKVPVIIRVDGKAFHTFCKRFKKPYDTCLNCMLSETMRKLCQSVQGTVFAERHSDEISLFVKDYRQILAEDDTTDAYFGYSIQKICSVVASTATAEFCKQLMSTNCCAGKSIEKPSFSVSETWPTFDCRCFNIPEHEVCNYFWWRMLDGKRNSISMLAQSVCSHTELYGKNSDEQQEMVFQKVGINWAKLPQQQKVGIICYKVEEPKLVDVGPDAGKTVMRKHWKLTGSPSTKSELDVLMDSIMDKDLG